MTEKAKEKVEEEKKETEFKSGLEIHQQLDTGKLFCRCPGILRQDEADYRIQRKLHAIAGETGEIDEAVKYEAGQDREFEYECYYDNVCLVDLDEEPPRDINQEALKIAIQVSLLLNCEILQHTQIMRKTVIDGSNVSGFQRTLMIAKKGYVDTEFGKVGIQGVYLEEDAARIIKREKEKTVYRLDRLGIPLLEIATSPDISDARQAKEAALKIGEILRACKVKRGIGTIRQDVNLSVWKNNKQISERIEIKGVQEPKLIEKTIEIEIKRQEKLIKEKKSFAEVRKALEDGKTEFLRPLPGKSRMYPETDLPLLYISRDLINEAKRELPKLKSEMRSELGKKGLHQELINSLVNEKKLSDFHELLKIYDKPDLVGKMLTIWISDLVKKTGILKEKLEKIFTLDVLETILQHILSGNISESDVYDVMKEVAEGKNVKEIKRVKIENLEEEVLKIMKEKPGLNENAYMGLVMGKFKGKVSGKQVMEIIKKIIKN